MFNIDDTDGKGIEDQTLAFILTVANSEYSPGGILAINGVSISVVDYHTLLLRYLNGNLGEEETFSIYTLAPRHRNRSMLELCSCRV